MPNGDVIDSLSLEIGASVNKSISAIDQLQSKLKSLNDTLSNFETNDGFKSKFEGLSKGLEGLGATIEALDLEKIQSVSKSLKELSRSSSKLGSSSGTGGAGIVNTPTSSPAINTSAISGASKLTTVLNGAKTVMKSFTDAFREGYNSSAQFGKGLRQVKAHAESLTGAIVKVRTIIWALRSAWNFVSGAVENASSLTEVQNVISNVYDASYIEEFNKAAENTITTLGMSKLSFEQYASRYQAMGKAMGITNSQMSSAEDRLKSMGIEYGVTTGKMGDMSVNLTRLAADMASFYDVSQEDVYTSLQAIYTGQTRPLMLAA